MPELPEVETVVQNLLQKGLVGQEIQNATIFEKKMVAPHSIEEFKQRVLHRPITEIARKGKYIFIKFATNEGLVVHLRMTGRFLWRDKFERLSKHEHIMFQLTDGSSLIYHDTRKFGRISYAHDIKDHLSHVGIDYLALDQETFQMALSNSTKRIKALLLDQSVFAGLGNIYVDEALWLVSIHPLSVSNQIPSNKSIELFLATQKVLQQGIERGGTTLGQGLGNFYHPAGISGDNQFSLQVYGRGDEPCYRCQQIITKESLCGRGTSYCPACQIKY